MRDQIRGAVLLIAGLAILASAMLHGFVNVPHLHEDLIELGVRRTLMGTVMLLLYFSVVAMFAFAGLVLNGAVSALRGRSPHQAPLWLVAACYVVFGVGAFALVTRSPHMLGYACMGMLVAVGAAMRPAHEGSDRRRVA